MSVQTSYQNTGSSRPLTQGEIDELAPKFAEAAKDLIPILWRLKEVNETIAQAQAGQVQARENQAQAREMQAQGRAMQARGKEMQAQGREKQAQGREKQAQGRDMQVQGREKQAQGREMKEKGLQGLREVAVKEEKHAKDTQDKLTIMFYGIFHGKTALSTDMINSLFAKYLNDGSLSMEETAEGKFYAKINFMRAVTAYLDNNPTVTKCNFLAFKGEIHDVATLASYLSKPDCKVTAIGVYSSISSEAKASLMEAVKARKAGLKVVYKD